MLHPERRRQNRIMIRKPTQDEDFSVTWAEVREIVNQMLADDEPMEMYKVINAVNKAWDKIFDERCEKYGVIIKDGDGE